MAKELTELLSKKEKKDLSRAVAMLGLPADRTDEVVEALVAKGIKCGAAEQVGERTAEIYRIKN